MASSFRTDITGFTGPRGEEKAVPELSEEKEVEKPDGNIMNSHYF